MNISYGYYVLTDNYDTYPAWIRCENYYYCENFMKLINFFKNK